MIVIEEMDDWQIELLFEKMINYLMKSKMNKHFPNINKDDLKYFYDDFKEYMEEKG